MIEDLKFVAGAVAKRDLVPAMTHFSIENGFVRSYNGQMGLCSSIDFHIDCMPKAIPLIKAIQNCKEQVTLAMMPSGRLSIRSGKFSAFIECENGPSPHVEPEGEFVDIDGDQLLTALKTIEPFIGNDASRQWTCGVLLRDNFAYATNNVMLIEYKMIAKFPRQVNIPNAAVDELLRIGIPCTKLQFCDNAVTFHFGEDRWLRTQLFSTEWPDLGKILDTEANPLPIDESIYDALSSIKPFSDKYGRAYIWKGIVSTHPDRTEGAMYEISDTGLGGLFRIEMLEKLQSVATHVDFGQYPRPCIFIGDNIRGAIIGMRA